MWVHANHSPVVETSRLISSVPDVVKSLELLSSLPKLGHNFLSIISKTGIEGMASFILAELKEENVVLE